MGKDLLTEAYLKLAKKLKSESRKIVRDPDRADDVLQDAFIRLWKKGYRLESHKDAEYLLRRTVRNVSLNEVRRNRGEPIKDDIADRIPPDARNEEFYARMRNAVDQQLTDVQKYILEERAYGGRTSEEIADDLGMEAPAVRMQLSRARRKLRKVLVAVLCVTLVIVVSVSVPLRGRYRISTENGTVTDKDVVMEDVETTLSDFFARQTNVETTLNEMFKR